MDIPNMPLIRLILALLRFSPDPRARQAARMTRELRMLARGKIYHYPGEAATMRRLSKLDRES